MFNIIETPRNFTGELLHDSLSSNVALRFNISHWRPYLVVSCSEEVFCQPSTALVVLSVLLSSGCVLQVVISLHESVAFCYFLSLPYSRPLWTFTHI